MPQVSNITSANIPTLTISSPRPSFNEERSMSSPNLRKKNPKSLALNLSPNSECFQLSEPSSPSFIKPPALKERKKPSHLSLNTGAANSILNDSLSSPGLPSMLHRRSLKHSVSTPHILSTPGLGPSGGMTLRPTLASSRLRDPITSTTSTLIDYKSVTQNPEESQTGVQMATRVPGACVGGDTFDRPHSGEDAKSPSYPEGPILMHEPNVYLYSEPNREEAMQFDVVINVAREVKCPFERDEVLPHILFGYSKKDANMCSTLLGADAAGTTLVERLEASNSALIAKSKPAIPPVPRCDIKKSFPEYVHVPWDHNTDVKDELWGLCTLIEARSKEGKKVLVHCQQGASRSATLIIAYGMYANQNLGPNEAYQLAQSKSRWVNPNMSLLFSLSDFKKMIDERKAEKIRKAPVKHRIALSTDMMDSTLCTSFCVISIKALHNHDSRSIMRTV
ncbi:hypothetical protein K3495_g2449 [Podosphaera aphanis]|nr:hypothetical protein K3495_g2449 [Podosphaera aphanis]